MIRHPGNVGPRPASPGDAGVAVERIVLWPAADLAPGMLVNLPDLDRAGDARHALREGEYAEVTAVDRDTPSGTVVYFVVDGSRDFPPGQVLPIVVQPVVASRLWAGLRTLGFSTRVVSRHPGHMMGVAERHCGGQLWRVTRMRARRGFEIRVRWGAPPHDPVQSVTFDPEIVTVRHVVRFVADRVPPRVEQ